MAIDSKEAIIGQLADAVDDARWQTVACRDKHAADLFVYAVSATGVYCRPGCGARRPRRDRVTFHLISTDAAQAGYRACKRCRPDEPGLAHRTPRAFRAVAQACGANPVAVVIPCHRVVRGDGNLTGYRRGIERKRLLLDRKN